MGLFLRLGYTILFIALFCGAVSAQQTNNKLPPGFRNPEYDGSIPAIELVAPSMDAVLNEDRNNGKNGTALRAGIVLPAHIRLDTVAGLLNVSAEMISRRVRINAEGAKALVAYFSELVLPNGSEIYVYNPERNELLGPAKNIGSNTEYALGHISGNSVIVELTHPVSETPSVILNEVMYIYRIADLSSSSSWNLLKESGSCNVNINCPEGSNWQDQKNGVVRILSKVSGSGFWCSGSLVNNTRNDFTPYILTADHCARNTQGVYATASDLNQWVFYFRYEAPGCENPTTNPPARPITGASYLASAPISIGSDFYLVKLNQDIPGDLSPYFNGWSINETGSPSGVSIHHPGGDIKKISTYTTALVSSYWNDPSKPYFWRVQWAPTANGHGVTEGGSSGSPIFNNAGLIVGQLTGGQASCTSPTAPDYYGKISASWQLFGSTPERQLRYWLDPDNTGVTTLAGSYNTRDVIANFAADTTVVTIGKGVRFSDQSANEPNFWKWLFQGGNPSEYIGRDPGIVRYSTLGYFNVTLIAGNEYGYDTLTRKKFIRVIPAIYPNPSQREINLLLGSHEELTLDWELYNLNGSLIESGQVPVMGLHKAALRFRSRLNGIYVLQVRMGEDPYATYRVMLRK